MAETRAEMLARLLRHGGRILLVGGGMRHLPREYHEHPQLDIWDDEAQPFIKRDVPSNTKAIFYNHAISHPARYKLKEAADALRIVLIPAEKREIRESLAIIMQPEVITPTTIETPIVVPEASFEANTNDLLVDVSPVTPPVAPIIDSSQEEDTPMVVKKRRPTPLQPGQMAAMLENHLRPTDTSYSGAKRLIPILSEKYGYYTNPGALSMAIRTYRRKAGLSLSPKRTIRTIKAPTMQRSAPNQNKIEASDVINALELAIEFIKQQDAQIAEAKKKTDLFDTMAQFFTGK